MKKVTASNASHSSNATGKNGKAHSIKAGAAKPRVKRPDFLASLEQLDYSEKVGARMLDKFHDSLS